MKSHFVILVGIKLHIFTSPFELQGDGLREIAVPLPQGDGLLEEEQPLRTCLPELSSLGDGLLRGQGLLQGEELQRRGEALSCDQTTRP